MNDSSLTLSLCRDSSHEVKKSDTQIEKESKGTKLVHAFHCFPHRWVDFSVLKSID